MAPENAAIRSGKKLDAVRELGHRIDFGRTADDYGRYRAGFPGRFFERLAAMGIIRAGGEALDLGTGTGTIARGLARRGMKVTGLDKSDAMIAQARHLDEAAAVSVRYLTARAEDTGLPASSLDLVTAGQCWHWFDRPRAAAEAMRILRGGGRIVIGHFDWIPLAGNVPEATENLIRAHNAEWNLWGGSGIYPQWFRDLGNAGFREIESFTFDIDVPYSQQAWRGRIRASAGVGAAMGPERVAQFDAALAAVLEEKFPEPMTVLHRVSAVIGTAP